MKKQCPTVPKKYAGKWIAWDHAGQTIIASARTLPQALKAARNTGEDDPQMMKVPRGLIVGWV